MIRLPSPVYAPDAPGAGAAATTTAAPPAPPAPPAPDNSALGTTETPPAPTVTELPENWRDLMSGSDAAFLEEANRYKTPNDMLKSLIETKKKVRSGSVEAEPMPGDDKPEEQKAWREKRGIPAEATGYKVQDTYQQKLTDNDKPLLDSFMQAAFKAGKPQAEVDFALDWYTNAMEEVATVQRDNDAKNKNAVEDTLRTEWGQDYRRNLTIAQKAMNEAIPGVPFTEARLPDGRRVGDVPELVKLFVDFGLMKWGDGELIGGEAVKASASRKAEIEGIMASDYDRYMREGLDKEYFKILESEDAATKRGVKPGA